MKRGDLVKKLEFGIEEAILFTIIILNFFDAFEILGSDFDYVKKIISWSALGILVYRTSPSKLFVGFKRKGMDFLLIIAYFAMIIKNFISYAYVAVNDASPFLKPFYEYLIQNSAIIEITGLYIGIFLIIAVSFNLSLRTPLRAPSILHLIRADRIKHDMKTFLLHFFSLIFISIGFFLVFFNLVMEWLAIAIDAPLLMIGLISYFLIIIKHRHRFSQGSFLKRFGDFGSDFYKGLMEHLRYKRAFLRVISGMLILHIITDLLTYIWHFVFGIGDQLYFSLIGHHPTLFRLLAADFSVSWATSIIHLANLVGLLFLMIIPIIMWFLLYFSKQFKFNNQMIILFAFSIFTMILNPTFRISVLTQEWIYGVDITGVVASQYQYIPFLGAIFIALFTTIVLFSINRKFLHKILIVISKLFFVSYITMYFYSISTYYLNKIPSLFLNSWFLALILLVFFIVTTIFYVVGASNFIIDTNEHLQDKLKF